MKLSAAINLYIAKRQAMGKKFYSPAAVLRALSRSYGDIELSSLTPDQMSSFLAGHVLALQRGGTSTARCGSSSSTGACEKSCTWHHYHHRPRSTRPASFLTSTLSPSCGCCWLPFLAASGEMSV
jgi:hypothetical protein